MAVGLAYQIVENPELLLLVLAILFTWYLAIYHFFKKNSVVKKHEGIVACFVLVFIFDAYPLDILSPEHLVGGDTNLINISIRLFFYTLISVLFSPWFSGFLTSLASLFKIPYFKPLFFWGLISFAWSETPVVSLRSFSVVFGVACLAAHFGKRYSWAQIESVLKQTILICSIISFVSVLIRTPLPGSIGLSSVNLEGSLSNKDLANLISLSSVLWILHSIETKRNRLVSMTIGVGSILMILYLNSATNVITSVALLYIVLLLYFVKRINSKQIPIAIWLTFVIGLVSILVIQIYSADIFALFGKEPHLSGRTSIVWPPVIDEIMKKPWTGYGYVGYWQDWRGSNDPSLGLDSPLRIATEYSDGALSHAHNGLLELGLQLGLPGIIFFLLSLFSGVSASINHFFNHKSLKISMLPLIIFAHMNLACLTETPRLGFVGPNYIWFFFIMTQVRLDSERRLD